MFNQYDRFRLAKPIEGEEFPVGMIGVVLEVFPDKPRNGYIVEFVDPDTGCNLGSEDVFTLTEDYLNPLK